MKLNIVEMAKIVKARNDKRINDLADLGLAQVKLYCEKTGEDPIAESGKLGFAVDEWVAGKKYELYELFTYNGSMGFVKQAHTAQAHYPPFSTGTEALYGARPIPNDDGKYPYVYNMAATVGMVVIDPNDNQEYVCIQDIATMIWTPSQIPAHFTLNEE